MPRVLVVIHRLPKSIGARIAYAKHVAQCMTGNARFPSPPVPMATFASHIAALDAAEVAVLTRAHGLRTARNDKLDVVLRDLDLLRAYVQTVAGQHPIEEAKEIVASAGMFVKNSSGPRKLAFAAKQGKSSGTVELSLAHPGGDASFKWQWSADGVNYVDAPDTTASSTTIPKLAPAQWYWFRGRVLTKDGLGDWSDPIRLLVE